MSKKSAMLLVLFLALVVASLILLAAGVGMVGSLSSESNTSPSKPDSGYRGSELVFFTNTEEGDYFHMRYLELAHAGYPIVFRDDARDVYGNPLEDRLAVYVPAGARGEIRAAFNRLEAEDPLSDARWAADTGNPYIVWEELGGIRGGRKSVEGRRLLARAFEKWAERGEKLTTDLPTTSYWEDISFLRDIARRLRFTDEPVGQIMAECSVRYPLWSR